MRLTEISIAALRVERGQRTFFDDSLKGFGVRVSQGGSKSYVVVQGKARAYTTLGRVDRMKLKEARDQARSILYAKPDPSTITFKEAREQFIAMRVKPNNKPSTAGETERLITRHFAVLDGRKIATLKAGNFLAITNALIAAGKPSEANHAFTAVKTMLRWARGQGYIDRHPLEDATRPYKPVSRDRWLTDEELAKVLATGQTGGLYGLLILVLLHTGQRLAQITNLRRSWIEGEAIRFPGSIMKNGQEHIIPIGQATAALLAKRNTDLIFENEDGNPFNNFGNGHREFLKKAGVVHFTRHDLRRTVSTHMARLGVPPHIIERLLAHQSGTISGVAAIYNRYSFMTEMREAVEKWEQHIYALAAPMSALTAS